MGEQTRRPNLSNDPQPASTAGLADGAELRAGDTPPAEGSMSGAVGDLHGTPNHGPVSGNRTPMIITLSIIGLIVLCFIGYGIAELIGYLRT